MPAHLIYDAAPLGSFIRFFDGTPQPLKDDAAGFESWWQRNRLGLLVRKDPPYEKRSCASPASVTFRISRYYRRLPGADDLKRTFAVDCDLRFELVERPAIGMFRVLRDLGGNVELLGVVNDLADAQRWRSAHPDAVVLIEEITADEHAADAVEGRSLPTRLSISRSIRPARAAG